MTQVYKDLIEELGSYNEASKINITSKLWKKAFNLHREKTGKRLRIGCDNCRATVYKWLESKAN